MFFWKGRFLRRSLNKQSKVLFSLCVQQQDKRMAYGKEPSDSPLLSSPPQGADGSLMQAAGMTAALSSITRAEKFL